MTNVAFDDGGCQENGEKKTSNGSKTGLGEIVRALREVMRDQLLEGLPVTERRLDLAGVSTSLLEGGEGPPIVLLHGQGGFAAMWGRGIPHLVESHRVVAPDLPGLGQSEVRTGRLDASGVVAWLGDLIGQTCTEPPTLVGHSLGGSFAARFAIEHGDRSIASFWSIRARSAASGLHPL